MWESCNGGCSSGHPQSQSPLLQRSPVLLCFFFLVEGGESGRPLSKVEEAGSSAGLWRFQKKLRGRCSKHMTLKIQLCQRSRSCFGKLFKGAANQVITVMSSNHCNYWGVAAILVQAPRGGLLLTWGMVIHTPILCSSHTERCCFSFSSLTRPLLLLSKESPVR